MRYHSSTVLTAKPLIFVLAAACLLAGCNSGDREVAAPPPTSAKSPTGNVAGGPAPITGGGPTSSGMMGSGGGEPPLNVLPLRQAQADYEKAKKAFDRSPKDDKAKKAYIDAANTLADSTMESEQPPNVKYPGALKLYKDVAKLDPSNAHATGWIKEINDIYASLHKAPPGGG